VNRPPDRHEQNELRASRIRELREQRQAPLRRKRAFEPVVLLGWFAAVIALAGVLIFLGFVAFAPTLMAWVEDNPGAIEHGLVRDFVDWYEPDALSDRPAGEDGNRISVTIELGSSDGEIGQQLFDEGLVRSRLAFHWAVQRAGREGTLQAGTYDLSPSMTPSAIVGALRQEAGAEVTITIREGWRLEEIVGYLGSTDLTMNLEEFAALVQTPPAELVAQYDFLADLPADRTLEGYLYPDTYRVFANASAQEIVGLLLDSFGRRVTQEMRDGIAAQGLSIDEAVALASIVEREAVLNEERPLIAGVYLNRINNPAGETVGLLQADPTLQYALATAESGGRPVDDWGSIEWWPQLQQAGRDVLLREDFAGYQTYQVQGLPPTPIASPRAGSMEAVAFPNVADGFFYFVAGCPNGSRDGSHYFGRTLDEHNANIARANEECPAE